MPGRMIVMLAKPYPVCAAGLTVSTSLLASIIDHRAAGGAGGGGIAVQLKGKLAWLAIGALGIDRQGVVEDGKALAPGSERGMHELADLDGLRIAQVRFLRKSLIPLRTGYRKCPYEAVLSAVWRGASSTPLRVSA
jgi:hypothetical protein